MTDVAGEEGRPQRPLLPSRLTIGPHLPLGARTKLNEDATGEEERVSHVALPFTTHGVTCSHSRIISYDKSSSPLRKMPHTDSENRAPSSARPL